MDGCKYLNFYIFLPQKTGLSVTEVSRFLCIRSSSSLLVPTALKRSVLGQAFQPLALGAERVQ